MHPANRHRFEPLDGLRGISVLAVIGYHTANLPPAGRIGVDLFFVLSGFLITNIIAKGYELGAKAFFPDFFKRRLVRLYPALVLACILYGALAVAFPWFESDPGKSILVSLLMVSNYTQAAELGFPTAFGHTWSLAVEWQFYLIWPILYFAVRSLGGGGRALLVALGVLVLGVWLSRFWSYGTLWSWRSLDARGDGLLYGCMLSIALASRPTFRLPAIVTWIAAGAFCLALFQASDWEHYWSNAISAVLILGVLGVAAPRLNNALSNPVLTYLGRISYGLYLYHFPLAALFYVAGFGSTGNLLLTTAISIPLAALSWRYVERPILNVSNRGEVLAKATAATS